MEPDLLNLAWNAQQLREYTEFAPAEFGVPEDQIGLCVRASHKSCVLEPSTREFPIQELEGRVHGQFGQRVHLEPETPQGTGFEE
eukprot:4643508-Karenia_brevis.AAC.1